ncbi:hypothetical protein RM704_37895 [Streptomyces sp. DSM 3412]|uniref:Secreted protein n=1 Tax=Streptomyces gottesmaniae TaxID=3075518 RepID=A0ABU2Z9X8_9ACTN|nr:hypothetical protein [Streptomyces sp. DSM 3412]MDT0573165.1 hypothetical protein [Streptomyces sp. DSM 3412]
MRFKTTAATAVALAALAGSASPVLASSSVSADSGTVTSASAQAAKKKLKTQKCDERHDVKVCITYRTKGNAGARTNQFVASVKSYNKNSFKARLTVTNQKTWHNDKYPKVKRDDYVEVTKKTKKNGHACAALYVGPSSHYPAWMACIN